MGHRHTMSNKSVSNLMKNVTLYGSFILAVLIVILLVVIKLRLLAKFGYYLGGVGLCLILVGTALLFNTGLLILGNLFILAGSVLIVGFERTKTYLHIFRENRCCGRGLARAGIVTFVSCLLATVITKIPLVNRILNWIPFL